MSRDDLRAAAFPKLDAAELASLAKRGGATLERYRDGDVLFPAGEHDVRFFVVQSGTLEIVDESGDEPRTMATIGPGEFTG